MSLLDNSARRVEGVQRWEGVDSLDQTQPSVDSPTIRNKSVGKLTEEVVQLLDRVEASQGFMDYSLGLIERVTARPQDDMLWDETCQLRRNLKSSLEFGGIYPSFSPNQHSLAEGARTWNTVRAENHPDVAAILNQALGEEALAAAVAALRKTPPSVAMVARTLPITG